MRVKPGRFSASAVGWLSEVEASTVLAVTVSPSGCVNFLIWSNFQESLAIFPAKEFDVLDGSMSSRWVFCINCQGGVDLAPAAWQADGFWERYHDGDPLAESVFIEEMGLILSECAQTQGDIDS